MLLDPDGNLTDKWLKHTDGQFLFVVTIVTRRVQDPDTSEWNVTSHRRIVVLSEETRSICWDLTHEAVQNVPLVQYEFPPWRDLLARVVGCKVKDLGSKLVIDRSGYVVHLIDCYGANIDCTQSTKEPYGMILTEYLFDTDETTHTMVVWSHHSCTLYLLRDYRAVFVQNAQPELEVLLDFTSDKSSHPETELIKGLDDHPFTMCVANSRALVQTAVVSFLVDWSHLPIQPQDVQ